MIGGKHYNDGSRKVFSGSSLGLIIGIALIAIAMVMVLLVYLPLTDEAEPDTSASVTVIGISYPDQAIGVGADLSQTYVTVSYEDGSEKQVALSDMVNQGLDVSVTGSQNVALSYGGFEQTISIEVLDVSCVLEYSASSGGNIQGETHQTVLSGNDAGRVVAIPETGYVFKEWNDGYPYASRKDTCVRSSRKYMANFEKETFRVVFFYYDGTVAREVDILYGQAVTDIPQPTDPKMEVYGKTFTGWSVEASDYQCVLRDMNIYPQYDKTATDVDLTVSKDQYGNGMGTTDVNECGYYAHNETGSITATPYNSREFNCWYIYGYPTAESTVAEWICLEKKGKTTEASVNVYIGDKRERCLFSSNSVDNAGTQYKLSFEPNENMDLIQIKAEFVYCNSTVTFVNYQNTVKGNQELVISDVAFGTTLYSALQEKKTSGTDAFALDSKGMLMPSTLPELNGQTKTYGMIFLGWYNKTDVDQNIVTGEQIFKEPTTLVAKWEKLLYELVFDYSSADNYTTAYSTQVVFQNTIGTGTNGGVPSTQPTAKKYDFIGWEDAITAELIDDTTQVLAKDKYFEVLVEGKNNFIDNQKIYFKPRWKVKEHTLDVSLDGAGTVLLSVETDMGQTSQEYISGQYVIYETYSYKISFFANVGNVVSSYTWAHSGKTDYFYEESSQTNRVTVALFEDSDNVFNIKFVPQKLKVTFQNGTEKYAGIVKDMSSDVPYGDSVLNFTGKAYASTLEYHISSPNQTYCIKEVRVKGKYAGSDHTGLNGEGEVIMSSETSEYHLILENCVSDIVVVIQYSTLAYNISIHQPTDGQKGGEESGTISKIAFKGTTSSVQASENEEVAPGESVFYEIEADEGKCLSTVVINGITYDIFAKNGDDIVFYDWEINGEKYGISLTEIDGIYYYTFGTADYKGTTYLYAKTILTREEMIFVVEDEENERYTLVERTESGARNSAPLVTFDEISSYLRVELKVEEKGFGDAKVTKDNRVTKVKVKVIVQKNLSLSVSTTDLTYSVDVVDSEYGDITVSKVTKVGGSETSEKSGLHTLVTADTASAMTSVVIKAKPIAGYSIRKYIINGVEKAVESSISSLTVSITLSAIDADKEVEFVYSPLAYDVTLIADQNNILRVTRNDEDVFYTLASGYTYTDCLFGSRYVFTVSAVEGKVITKVVVVDADSTEHTYPVTYNMSSFRYVYDTVGESKVIRLTVGDKEEQVASAFSVSCVENSARYAFSVQYDTNDTILTCVASSGYNITDISITGFVGGIEKTISLKPTVASYDLTNGTSAILSVDTVLNAGTSYQKSVCLVLPNSTFDGSSDAVVSVSTFAENYMVSLSDTCSQKGTVSCTSVAGYGKTETISIQSNEHYYIEYFKINGTMIQFTDENWSAPPTYDFSVGQYISGTYKYTVYGDTYVDVKFACYNYSVSLSSSSVNGVTDISINSSTETGSRVEYGGSVTISMKANEGYHIKGARIEGENNYFYLPTSSVSVNALRFDTAVYNNVERNLVIVVEYEINRYGFHYEIINDSANFSSLENPGWFSCDASLTIQEEGVYQGIAHGDNFVMNITPSLSTGYYLYAMSITYKASGSANAIEKIRYYDDGSNIVPEQGGAVWFNKFWFEATQTPTGVTTDIESIKFFFRRYTYSLTLDCKAVGGSLMPTFVNPTASQNIKDIIIYGQKKGTNEEPVTFYYSTVSNDFYIMVGESKEESGLTIAYSEGDYGEVQYKIGADEYILFLEYGLRVLLDVTPQKGYNRTEFVVNGEDRLNFISNDSYGFNIYKSSSASASYEIKKFSFDISTVIYNNSTKKYLTPVENTGNAYIAVTVEVTHPGQAKQIINMADGSLGIALQEVEYGTVIKVILYSKFNDNGVYLYNLSKKVTLTGNIENMQQLNLPSPGKTPSQYLAGDVYGTVTYGEIEITEQISLSASFQMKEYAVETEILYNGENIVGENKNSVRNENNNTDRWTIFWGNSCSVKVSIANDILYFNNSSTTYKAYELVRIVITNLDTNEVTTLEKMDPTENYIGLSTDTYYYREDESHPVYGVRNALYLNRIKANLKISVVLQRKAYQVVFVADANYSDSLSHVEKIVAKYNQSNSVYPRKTVDSSVGVFTWTLDVRHFDELQVEIVPKEGYAIATDYAVVAEIEAGGSGWVTTGRQSQYTYRNGIFRLSDGQTASQNHIYNNCYIYIPLAIKVYSLDTKITRTDSSNDTSKDRNNTIVNLVTKTQRYNGETIESASFVKGGSTKILKAQHNGVIEYSFTTPAGYRLSSFKANGYTLEELKNKGILLSQEVKANSVDSSTYDYTLLLSVNTDLINGSGTTTLLKDINIEIVLSVIEYNIVILVNDQKLNFGTYNNRNGVSDNKTITFYSPQKVNHFSSITVTPLLSEGYEIPLNGTSITLGTSSRDEKKTTAFAVDQYNLASVAVLYFNNSTVANADLSKEYTTVYIHINTSILKYHTIVNSMVYYSKNGDVAQTNLKSYTVAGTVAYSIENAVDTSVNREDDGTSKTANSTYGAIDKDYPYFSKVTLKATANSGFAVFGIYEYVTGTWVKVQNGDRGLILSEKMEGVRTVYTLSYTIGKDNNQTYQYNQYSYSGRQFRIDFKQKTEVTFVMPNPYKYVTTSKNAYQFYYSFYGYESDVANKDGSTTTQKGATQLKVQDEYKFDVFVGNYLSVRMVDMYTGEDVSLGIYRTDLSTIASDLIYDTKCYINNSDDIPTFSKGKYEEQFNSRASNNLVAQLRFGGDKNVRYRITGKETFYVYDEDNYARVSATKVSNGAKADEDGGYVLYNDNKVETNGNVIYRDESTKSGKLLTIRCRAKENYAFYRIKFRNVNTSGSKQNGYIVFESTAVSAWQSLYYMENYNNGNGEKGIPKKTGAVANFNTYTTNDYVLVNYTEETQNLSTGKVNDYVFTLWMNGDVEIEAEFYHTYDVTYGVTMIDREEVGYESGIIPISAEDVSDNVYSYPFYNASLKNETSVRISYGSTFRLQLTSTLITDVNSNNYVFVGWYVNGINTYTALNASLPDKDYYTMEFNIFADAVPGLTKKDGNETVEVSTIEILARFEPVVNVQLINEKFYSTVSSFQSWNMGKLSSEYYAFDTKKVSKVKTSSIVQDRIGRNVADAYQSISGRDFFSNLLPEAQEGEESYVGQQYGYNWSALCTDSNVSSNQDKKVYSSSHYFKTLYDKLNDEGVWEESTISLHYTTSDTDFIFSSWQYYNWGTGLWQDIGYSYADESYGVSSDGNAYLVTCFSENYEFALKYLFATETIDDNIEYLMPYAISSEHENNLGGNRPLLIRADIYKTIEVTLQQYAFSTVFNNEVGLAGVDTKRLSDSVVTPIILPEFVSATDNSDRNYINSDNVSGTFEYGTLITIANNSDNPGGEVIRGITRYRFIGWYVDIGGKTYLLGGSDDLDKLTYDFSLVCLKDKVKSYTLKAYYVAQYRQSISSYGISGSTSHTYAESVANRAGEASPEIYITSASSETGVEIESITMQNNAIAYDEDGVLEKETVYKFPSLCHPSDYAEISPTDKTFDSSDQQTWMSHEDEAGYARLLIFYMDAGFEYELHVKKSEEVDELDSIQNQVTGADYGGFNPEFDTLYRLIEDSSITQDFSSFYRTGNGTYYTLGQEVSPAYILNRTLKTDDEYYELTSQPDDWAKKYTSYFIKQGNGVITRNTSKVWLTNSQYYYRLDVALENWTTEEVTNEDKGVAYTESKKVYTANKAHTVEIQYISTATLVFYNVMYGAGISLENAQLNKVLTGQTTSSLTVWDDNGTKYGDWVANGNTVQAVTGGNNGEIVLRIPLIDVSGSGYKLNIRYTLAGMNDGYGIQAGLPIVDHVDNANSLFSPSSYGYTRWLEVDLNDLFARAVNDELSSSLLFGKGGESSNTEINHNQVGIHMPTPYGYTIANCGEGTQDNPYLVYCKRDSDSLLTDTTQLKFINIFWKDNGYTCTRTVHHEFYDEVTKTYFKIQKNSSGLINLIDFEITGFVAGNDNPLNSVEAWTPLCGSNEPDSGSTPETKKGFDGVIDGDGVVIYGLAAAEFDSYFGLFGKVINGEVKNFILQNVYANGNGSATASYLAGLCGYAYNSTFSGITIRGDLGNCYSNSTFSGSTDGAFVYITSTTGSSMVGAVIAYAKDCEISNISMTFPSCESGATAEVYSTGFAGTMFGSLEGCRVSGVSISGSEGYIVSNASALLSNSSGAGGGVFGYIGASLDGENKTTRVSTVSGISMVSGISVVIGKTNLSVVGGLIGIVGPDATVSNINFPQLAGSSYYNFGVDYYNTRSVTKGTFLQARSASASTNAMGSNISGYGFAGSIAGLNYGTISATELDGKGFANYSVGGNIVGYIHTYAGTAGGIVGGNFGTVEYFTLGEQFRLYAWEPEDKTYSFNYGGVVGYNFDGTASAVISKNGSTTTISFSAKGLVHDCVLRCNANPNASATGTSAWQSSSVYVFCRKSQDDTGFYSENKFLTETSEADRSKKVTNDNTSDLKNYLVVGGICGYNSGRLYNSGVKNVRVSTYRYRKSQDTSSLLGYYSWAVYAGLVCGYFAPRVSDIRAWNEYLSGEIQDQTFDPTDTKVFKNINNGRIQSCFAQDSSIVVSHYVWMDNKWEAEQIEDYSCAFGVSLAGICGGSSANADSEYAINCCYSSGNVFKAPIYAYGATSTEDNEDARSASKGWGVWEYSTGKVIQKSWYRCKCIRPWCVVELNVASVAGGLTYGTTGSDRMDANSAGYCYSSGNSISEMTYLDSASQNKYTTFEEIGSESAVFGLGKDGAELIEYAYMRYVKYNNMTKGDFPDDFVSSKVTTGTGIVENMGDTTSFINSSADTSYLQYGFYVTKSAGTITDIKIIKTDPLSGCLYACSDGVLAVYYNKDNGNTPWQGLASSDVTSYLSGDQFIVRK